MPSPPDGVKSSLASFQGFLLAEWRRIALLYLLSGLPSLLWQVAVSRLLQKPPFGQVLVSFAFGLLHTFGALSLALHASAWLEQRKCAFAQLSRQAWKLFAAFFGTLLAGGLVLQIGLVPVAIGLSLLASGSWNGKQVQWILRGLVSVASPFLLFFSCPLLVLRGLLAFRNVSQAIQMSIRQARLAAVLSSPLIVLAILIFAATPASSPTDLLYALDRVLLFLAAGLQVCAFPPEP
jgi:hypothetical protein